MGGSEPGVPEVWNTSIKIAKNWEAALDAATTPSTRKVALRSAIMMGIDKGSAFEIFSRLSRVGLGGRLAGGRQYVSWIHEVDFGRAVEFLIDRSDMCGAVNVCSPNPLPQADFARGIRDAWHVPVGLPAAPWMIELGAWALNGDSELVMKSRRVVPTRLLESGFGFQFPQWPAAAVDLVARMRSSR
jgi:NAD dependent epimerase/dehydratase family enzyme